MSLGNLAALGIVESYKKLGNSPSIVEFGNQRISISKQFLRDHLKIKMNLEDKFRNTPSASHFYTAVGFSKYVPIELNSKDGALVMDLNHILREKYGYKEEFDLVVNNGTGEHIWNQHSVFANQHNLVSVGGLILNIVPFIPNLNHGFYNYNPIIFRDLAFANNYSWQFLLLGDNLGNVFEMDINSGECWREVKRQRPYSFSERYSLRRPKPYGYLEDLVYRKFRNKGHIYIVACYKKNENKEFVIPLQGKWIHNIDSELYLNPEFADYLAQPDTFKTFHS